MANKRIMSPYLYTLLSFILVVVSIALHAQTTAIVNTQQPFKEGDSVYQAADFPGGAQEWMAFIERNLHPQTPADNKAPVGVYKVEAGFAIDTAGNVVDIKILQNPGYGTAEDVIKLLNKSPQWLPASINGKAVIYRQKQNFTYQVTEK